MMTADDLRMVVGDLAASTKAYIAEYVTGALGTLRERVASLEAGLASVPLLPGPAGEKGDRGDPGKDAEPMPGPPGPKGDPGRDAEPPDLDAIARKAAVLVPKPLDGAPGKDADPLDLLALHKHIDGVIETRAAMVTSLVQHEIKALPLPKDGTPGRDGKDAAPVDLDALAAKAAALIPVPMNGRDGASVTVADVAPLITAEIADRVVAAVKALPLPTPGRDGASVTVDDLRPVVAELVQAAVSAVPRARDGADGIGVAGAIIDRDGRLILTLSNGATQELGAVVGRDGKDYEPERVKAWIVEEVAKIPRPKDGERGERGMDGKDGADGLGFDNLDLKFTDTTGYVFVCESAGRVKEWPVAIPWDAGVWRQGRSYPQGAGVTFKGNWWIAQSSTFNRPSDTKDWRLSVRRGEDGKDAKRVDGTD